MTFTSCRACRESPILVINSSCRRQCDCELPSDLGCCWDGLHLADYYGGDICVLHNIVTDGSQNGLLDFAPSSRSHDDGECALFVRRLNDGVSGIFARYRKHCAFDLGAKVGYNWNLNGAFFKITIVLPVPISSKQDGTKVYKFEEELFIH